MTAQQHAAAEAESAAWKAWGNASSDQCNQAAEAWQAAWEAKEAAFAK